MRPIMSDFHCVECDEVITNPICSVCLSEKMQFVVAQDNPALAVYIDAADVGGESLCLFCGRHMGVCAHCFSKDIYSYLCEKDLRIAKEFMQRFDFQLRSSASLF